jgi:hypothetical protein
LGVVGDYRRGLNLGDFPGYYHPIALIDWHSLVLALCFVLVSLSYL